jgi:membrane protease YdiL (CAAX protease family)
MATMARHRPERGLHRSTLIKDCGLVPPDPKGTAWLTDTHFVAATLAAIPVWLGLGIALGGHMRAVAGWSAWVSFVLVLPVVEELVFRGLLQGQLLRLSSARRIGPLTLANLCTTAGFVLMHLAKQPPYWALGVAVPSLVFGHLRERFGSVLPPMLLHALYNAGFGLTAWWVHP